VPTASVAIVSLAFTIDSDFVLPAGSGMLIPASQGVAVKGLTISSQKWPGAPAGLAFMRASLGRVGEEFVLQREDAELIDMVRTDLAALLGVMAAPVDAAVTRWGGGLPQYEVGHLDMVARVRASVATIDGLAVAGATYDGVGIPACIASAREAVTRVADFLMRPAVDNEPHGRR
jgi:oxygen-dependent protoporphyrinogen oxidase